MIIFSIVIPHINIPELLERCLASIPERDDLEVIIVDDNSDPNIVDFEHFPGQARPNTTVIFDKSGKGAGRARNVGLEYAKGKWVLFVDADDYVLPCLSAIFDNCVDSDADVIYFRPTAVMLSDRKTPSKRDTLFNHLIDEYLRTRDENDIRTLFLSPCSIFVRKGFIDENHIRFEEIRYSNDNFFSVSVGCLAKKIEVHDDTFYVITQRENSLTSNFMQKPGELRCRAEAFYRASKFVVFHGYRIAESIAFDFIRRLYINKDYKSYRKYYYLLKSYLKLTRKQMIDRIFIGYSRKHKLLCYLHSELINRYYGK